MINCYRLQRSLTLLTINLDSGYDKSVDIHNYRLLVSLSLGIYIEGWGSWGGGRDRNTHRCDVPFPKALLNLL